MSTKKNTEIEPYPWEPQPGETAKKYEAFQCYLNMKTDTEDRSLRKVAFDLNKSLTYIGTLSSQFKWVERADAYDKEQLRLAQKEQIAAIKKMRKRHANISVQMLTKAMQKMSKMSEDELSPQDVKAWVETASKLERLSRGDTSEVIEERDGGSAINPVSIYIPDNGRDGDNDEE